MTVRLGVTESEIVYALKVLRAGRVIAFPTDTVYGVGAHALRPAAVERLYAVKERSRNKAIPLLVASAEALEQVSTDVPQVAYDLAAHFWPGALTIVLRKSALVPDAVTAGGDTVAIRAPDHPVPQALLARLDAPLAATSANISGRPAPDTAEGVMAQLAGRVDLLLDGGRCPGGVASTVLDLTTTPPTVLRIGGVSPAELERVAGRVVLKTEPSPRL